jgi:hypothetical protein
MSFIPPPATGHTFLGVSDCSGTEEEPWAPWEGSSESETQGGDGVLYCHTLLAALGAKLALLVFADKTP